MHEQIISFSEIRPFVRYVQRLRIDRNTYPVWDDVCPYDCRYFYVQSGHGSYRINGIRNIITQGQVFLFGSGQPYYISSAEDDPLVLLGVNFDYTQANADRTIPIPPVPVNSFITSNQLERVTFSDSPKLNTPVLLSNMQVVEDSLIHMLHEYKARKLYFGIQLSGLFADILITTIRHLVMSDTDANTPTTRVESILKFIRDHYMEDLNNDKIGAHFGYHPNYINHQIRLYTGKPLHQYLIRYRISQAVDLLVSTDLSISEIAYRVGFKDLCHFNKSFRQIIGTPPGRYRVNSGSKN